MIVNINPSISGHAVENFNLIEFFEHLDAEIIHNNYKDRYTLTFQCEEKAFFYGNCDILTIINDLALELENIDKSKSHFLTICGYKILFVNVSGKYLEFYDPSYGNIKINRTIPICIESKSKFRELLFDRIKEVASFIGFR